MCGDIPGGYINHGKRSGGSGIAVVVVLAVASSTGSGCDVVGAVGEVVVSY